MTAFLAAVASGATVLVLLLGCAAHLSRPSGLPAALRAHRVVPGRAVPVLALAVLGAEGLLALAGAGALLTRSRTALTAVLALSGVLFGAYALYARHVVITGRDGPCGCTRTDLPMNGWVAARALALAVLALTGALLTGPARVATPGGGAAEWSLAALAACAFAGLLWMLPAALHDPEHRPAPARVPAAGGTSWTS